MKRIAYLAVAALVAMLILVPTALAQTTTQRTTIQSITTPTPSTSAPLPESGGLAVGSVVLPAAALLLGSGVLAYAVLRRR
jgi:hypothetical protein